MNGQPQVTFNNEITDTPEAVVKECYRYISFEAGSEPDWDRFKALFVPKSVLALRVFPEDEAVTVMDIDEYTVIQMREGMKEHGYSERIIKEEWFKHGDVAETRIIFEMQFGSDAPVRAFDIFQLVRLEDRWWIVSIMSEIPKAGESMPL